LDCFKLQKNVSNNIRKALIKIGLNKGNESSIKNLPYTIEELKKHLESQFESWMSWDNYGIYDPNIWDDEEQSTWTWQLDHISPHSNFKYRSFTDPQFIECWALSNLRPLNSKQNQYDGVNRIRH
jgi:hypothetical protein